jgi:hypothetical protein
MRSAARGGAAGSFRFAGLPAIFATLLLRKGLDDDTDRYVSTSLRDTYRSVT